VLRWAAADTAAGWKGCTKKRCHPEGAFFAPKDLCSQRPRSQEWGFFCWARVSSPRLGPFLIFSA
jgi:hypothetical protein